MYRIDVLFPGNTSFSKYCVTKSPLVDAPRLLSSLIYDWGGEKFGASVRLIYWRPYGCLPLFSRFSVDLNVLLREAGRTRGLFCICTTLLYLRDISQTNEIKFQTQNKNVIFT